MSTAQPEGAGTSTKSTRWRVIVLIGLLVAVAVTVAALFVAFRQDGSAAESPEDVSTTVPDDSASEATSAAPSAPAIEPSVPPTEEAEEPAQEQWTSYTTADGVLQFDHPAGWSVRALSSPAADQFNGTTEEREVVNEQGQVMAELITGVVTGFEQMPGVPYHEFEYVPLTGLEDKEPDRGDVPAFVFQALELPDGFTAHMAITDWGRFTEPESAVLVHGFSFIPGTSGAFFHRPIAPDTALPVDPALTGAPRLEAYMQTEEYSNIKQMMMSVRFVQ